MDGANFSLMSVAPAPSYLLFDFRFAPVHKSVSNPLSIMMAAVNNFRETRETVGVAALPFAGGGGEDDIVVLALRNGDILVEYRVLGAKFVQGFAAVVQRRRSTAAFCFVVVIEKRTLVGVAIDAASFDVS